MKVVVTGQVGLNKKAFLNRVADMAAEMGHDTKIFNVGDMMYAEAPDVAKGKILDLPVSRLENLRRSVFKDILAEAKNDSNIIVNTHATFRWNHGLFFAFDHDQLTQLDADLYIVMMDNIDRVHYKLSQDGHIDHTLKDLMVWREEELLTTELLSKLVKGHGCFYICVKGTDETAVETVVRLMYNSHEMKKAYISFPMSHVMDMPAVLAEINEFRTMLKRHMICFDPADMEEKPMCFDAIEAAQAGKPYVEVGPENETAQLDTRQLMDIIPDIDGQIYVRDFKLIDQADMIIALVPELADGKPALSSGVERELHHAHESTRDVYIIWKPKCDPSMFITETATKVFRSTQEAMAYFVEKGFIGQSNGGPLFE